MATCLHPTNVRGKLFPCGKCPVCRQNYRQSLSNRMLLESAFCGGPTFFITLTYDDVHLPFTLDGEPCFDKVHVQNFNKYVRNDGLKYSYFFTSEYGSQTKRPHYHGLLFCREKYLLSDVDEIIRKNWKHGFIQIALANDAMIAYAAKYALKDEFFLWSRYPKGDKRNAFRLFSQKPAIGESAIPFLNEYIYNNGDIRKYFEINGKKVIFDTYIKRHIDPSVYEELKAATYEKEFQEIQDRLFSSYIANSQVCQDGLGEQVYMKDYTKDNRILQHRYRLKQLKEKL